MKICVIHGSNRKGNTDATVEIIKEQLNLYEEIEYSDIYLPKDLPCFCAGCFACFEGEYAGQNCPNKQYTHPILKTLLSSDGIIVACPCYALAETGQIKVFFDHFACTFINHRPNEEMFDKIGLVVSTGAGAGTGRVVSTISRNLLFWGVKRIIKFRINMFAANWDEMPVQKRDKVKKLLRRKASRFYRLTKDRREIRKSISVQALRRIFKGLVNSYEDTQPDKIFWKSKGWIK
ncbi:MAG: NAD(P)H-dependent oxidoreductase [Defluviitaleaceae bacterium]|nr:NAD(P)H-dependent oxidoreductase [Defluviitaleaceae bacterium]MCL2263089.1 NAD(P)H-dependent oxidoreductase [Defluviitaleaceae bacterium]